MRMSLKVYLVILISVLQPIYSNAFNLLNFGPDCISLPKLYKATKILCENRDNATLWQQAIDCHDPISEKFMRMSAEARCPVTKEVQDPMDLNYSLQEVFFNICGLIEEKVGNVVKGNICLLFGSKDIMSHKTEVNEVKKRWGYDVPCNIGKCVLNMGLNL